MLEGLPRPAIIAHRGASAHAPENTLAAFQLAATEGADAIELDAKLSADGQVVVFHDATLERTTNGRGRLSEKSLNELRELDAGSRFSEEYAGQKIPLLAEVLEAFGRRLFINVELSNYRTPHDSLVPKVCDLVRTHALQSRVLLSSFLPSNLQQAARLLGAVPRGLLAMKGWTGSWARSFGFSFGEYEVLQPHVADASAQQIRRVHRLKRRIFVWTVNEAEAMQRLTDWGVDGISTDDPVLALRTARRAA
jgi:glycerophosphoryl diester phosphodiesterase